MKLKYTIPGESRTREFPIDEWNTAVDLSLDKLSGDGSVSIYVGEFQISLSVSEWGNVSIQRLVPTPSLVKCSECDAVYPEYHGCDMLCECRKMSVGMMEPFDPVEASQQLADADAKGETA